MNRKNNIAKILILIGAIILASFFAFSYYENFNNSSNLNKFLEEASTVSLVHSESAKEFEKVLNFDEINAEFENWMLARWPKAPPRYPSWACLGGIREAKTIHGSRR